MKKITTSITEIDIDISNYIEKYNCKDNSNKYAAYLLFHSMLEIIKDQLILLDAKSYISFFILMRCAIERYADLINLCQHETTYFLNIKYTLLHQKDRWMKNIEEYKEISEAFMNIYSKPNYMKEKIKLNNKMSFLKSKKAKKITSKGRFIDFHKDDKFFISLYDFSHQLSEHVHGGLLSLIQEKEDSTSSEVKFCLQTILYIMHQGLSNFLEFHHITGEMVVMDIQQKCCKLTQLVRNHKFE